jgi:hypothetical protein
MDEHTKEFYMHNDALSEFHNRLYANIFTHDNIVSKKKALPLSKKKKVYGYFLERDRESYFMQDVCLPFLPFRVEKAVETDYKSDVFKFIEKIDSIVIPSEKRMEFRELVDMTPMFHHSNPLHFKLYKIVAFTSYVDRINARISTDAGFGKDSVINIVSSLVDSTANLYGGSFAKLEFVLTNKLIVLNELGNLKADDMQNMQEFLLATGAYFNTYHKRTRKTTTTQEIYDISKLSLMVFYNLPEYYSNKAQEYFDQMFTKAVCNRFIPFVFKGQITTRFQQILDIPKIVDVAGNTYKDIIATLHYFKENKVKDIKYNVNKEVIKFTDDLKRYERTFYTIMKWIGEYAQSQQEFEDLSVELYKCYRNYNKLISKEQLKQEEPKEDKAKQKSILQ